MRVRSNWHGLVSSVLGVHHSKSCDVLPLVHVPYSRGGCRNSCLRNQLGLALGRLEQKRPQWTGPNLYVHLYPRLSLYLYLYLSISNAFSVSLSVNSRTAGAVGGSEDGSRLRVVLPAGRRPGEAPARQGLVGWRRQIFLHTKCIYTYLYIYMLTPPLDPPWAGLHMWPVREVSQIITRFTSHITFPHIILYTSLAYSKLDTNWTKAPKSKRPLILNTFPHIVLYSFLSKHK